MEGSGDFGEGKAVEKTAEKLRRHSELRLIVRIGDKPDGKNVGQLCQSIDHILIDGM